MASAAAGVGVGLLAGGAVGLGVAVAVAVTAGVRLGLALRVTVKVALSTGVALAVGVGVRVALGVAVGQIAKSVIFRRKSDDVAVLVVTSGDKRVDEKKVAALVGGALGRADPEFVKTRTGFTIGGVSPVAHATPPVTLIDRELYRFEEVWAAAGHPNGVFKAAPADLERLTGAPTADVVAE